MGFDGKCWRIFLLDDGHSVFQQYEQWSHVLFYRHHHYQRRLFLLVDAVILFIW